MKVFAYKVPNRMSTNPNEPDPPITRHVRIPAVLTVQALVRVGELKLSTVISDLLDLNIYAGPDQPIDFAHAQKILRKHGIGADAQGI